MIRERQRNELVRGPITLFPGDRLIATVKDELTGEEHTFEEEIGRTMVVDTVVTFDCKDEFGLKDGIGAVFGK